MGFSDALGLNALLDWLSRGLWDLAWWQIVLFTLAVTHVTIASVTIFLHRHQAHRALDLHPIASHFFRFWLWFTTGTVTREWTAVHRKHHAKCEQQGDPHSPVVFGIKKVFWQGYELYRAECANAETVQRFGHNTPKDWLESHLYARHASLGLALLLVLDLALFGALGLTVWAVQLLWIPVTAAGIASVHHRPIAITATASTRCPATERPAGVGKAIRATDNPAIKTVIRSARHSPFTASSPLSPVG